MLRKIRIALAAVFFIGITLLFVGIGHSGWGWMAKLQFLPSLLALNFAVVAGILLLTFVCGRFYCAVICPMGVFQDLVLWIRRQSGKRRQDAQVRRLQRAKETGSTQKPQVRQYLKRFSFNPERKWVRYGVLVLSVISIIASGQMLIALIAPYSAYGRVVRSLVGLVSGSIALPLLLTGLLTLVLIFACAWLWGRAYCNTVCPVGTTLGLVSRFALFRPVIDTDKCTSCGRCERGCRSSCIDAKAHKIDASRCVNCFDCLDNCQEGALTYRYAYGKDGDAPKAAQEDKGRRAFLTTTAFIGSALAAKSQTLHADGGFADVTPKEVPGRDTCLVPPGARSVKSFYDHCTACQLCVSACPNGVLRPSSDFAHFLQPQMGYENGFCRPECTECSQVCPAGAILPVREGEKLNIQIGLAQVDLSLCFAATGKETCGNCEYHCPSGAILMVEAPGYPNPIPTVAEAQCIGCGACEFLCPSRPISAITVNGRSTHHSLA